MSCYWSFHSGRRSHREARHRETLPRPARSCYLDRSAFLPLIILLIREMGLSLPWLDAVKAREAFFIQSSAGQHIATGKDDFVWFAGDGFAFFLAQFDFDPTLFFLFFFLRFRRFVGINLFGAVFTRLGFALFGFDLLDFARVSIVGVQSGFGSGGLNRCTGFSAFLVHRATLS